MPFSRKFFLNGQGWLPCNALNKYRLALKVLADKFGKKGERKSPWYNQERFSKEREAKKKSRRSGIECILSNRITK